MERALDSLLPQVYEELRRLARSALRGQRGQHHQHGEQTLEPTALVHEAYLKLAQFHRLDISDRPRFLALAARAMRQVLVDHARARNSAKRGGGALRVTFGDDVAAVPAPAFDLVSLDAALERLGLIDGRKVRVVELRYLAGLSVGEVAAVLGISEPTVKRDSALAKAWLFRELSAADDGHR